MAITYANDSSRDAVLEWSRRTGIDGAEQLAMHIQELFAAEAFDVLSVQSHDGFIVVRVQLDGWREPRDFGLLNDGRLTWTNNA